MKMLESLKGLASNVTAFTIWFNSLFSSFAEFLQPFKNINSKDEIIYFIPVFVKLLVTSGVYGGLRLLPQIFVQKPDFKLSENSDTKADFRNPPYTMLPPVRARNIIPG